MSIKITHTIIIVLSILLTGLFSYVMFVEKHHTYATPFFILGTLSTILLTYYLITIVKKFRTI
tara:strand:- start:306 stop:494 length:189 start_codon:yes stop_codon:yes gene_type:complete